MAHTSNSDSEQVTEQREQRQERHEMRSAISDKTPVQLGLLVALLMILMTVLGFSGSGIWWASKLSEKVDTVLRNQAVETEAMSLVQKDVAELQAWRKVVDVAGTPSASARLDALNKELIEVKEMIKMHMAKEDRTKPN